MKSAGTGENTLKGPTKRRQKPPSETYRGHGVTLVVTRPGDGTMEFRFQKDE